MKKTSFLLLLFCFVGLVNAEALRHNNNPVPVVIAPFQVIGNAEKGVIIADIVRDNLNRFGRFDAISSNNIVYNAVDFDYWKSVNKDAIIFGRVEEVSSKVFNVDIYVYDIYTKKRLYGKKIAVHNSGIRRIAHFLSDKIYNLLLGQKGAFDTRLTYVTISKDEENRKIYQLEIADSDGHNSQTVIKSQHPILSPSWSPDQRKIAYVSFKNGRSEVFVKYPFMQIKTIQIPQFDDIVSSPSWHPSGDYLLMSLSDKGNQDIYLYSLKNAKIRRLTTDSAVDTEATFSPDGKNIAFTSNRSGTTQIYLMNIETGKINQVPIGGDYNTKPAFSPSGEQLAFIHKVNKDKRLSYFDVNTKKLTILTQNEFDDSPSFSPNGEAIVFSTKKENKERVALYSLTNNQVVDLDFNNTTNIIEPSWTSYTNGHTSNKASFPNLVKSSDDWKCASGYVLSNTKCIKKSTSTVPRNAYASGDSWKCNYGYYKSNSYCSKLPPNASAYTSSDGFYCKSGYKKSGSSCIKQKEKIPENAYASNSDPQGWKCKFQYEKSGNSCIKRYKPNNSFYTRDGWKCKTGYKRVGASCEKELPTIYIDDGKYVGELRDGEPHGQGTYTITSGEWAGDKYIGEFKDGDFHGKGTYYYSNGDKYAGEFKDDKRHGRGTYTHSDGTTEEGVWANDEFLYANKTSPNTTTPQDSEKVMPASSGSGFAVTSDGYVVTNYHVIQGCSSVEIYTRGKVIPSYIVGVDPQNDLAILKGGFKPLYYYPLKRDNPQLLMDVFVAGFPFGFDISTPVKVTKGIVSSLSGVGNNYSNIQIDAAVQPGSSGGPILDDKGNVAAVTVAKLDLEIIMEEYGVVPEDTNFGIKSNVVVNFLESNGIKLPNPNIKKVSASRLGEMITDGTYYLSCLMTQSQINKMREKKVMFSNID